MIGAKPALHQFAVFAQPGLAAIMAAPHGISGRSGKRV